MVLESKNYGSVQGLRIYFAVQIPPFIDWTWTAEMTLSLQVDLVLSDTASTTTSEA